MLLLHDFYTALWKSIYMNVIPCLNKHDDDDHSNSQIYNGQSKLPLLTEDLFKVHSVGCRHVIFHHLSTSLQHYK